MSAKTEQIKRRKERKVKQMGLTDRKKRILRAIVETYIATAEPVGSKAVAERAGLDVSTATIRTVAPCLIERAGRLAPLCAEIIDDLKREQARIEASIMTLAASRDAIGAVIAAGQDAARRQRP